MLNKSLLMLSTLLFCLLSSCQHSQEQQEALQERNTATAGSNQVVKSDIRKTFDDRFTHVVYFWFKDPDDKKGKALFEKSLRTFLNHSKYAKTHFIGTPPVATRDVVDGSFTYSLILSFASAEDQQLYQTEAVHQVFIEESSHLWEKVVVYDAQTIK